MRAKYPHQTWRKPTGPSQVSEPALRASAEVSCLVGSSQQGDPQGQSGRRFPSRVDYRYQKLAGRCSITDVPVGDGQRADRQMGVARSFASVNAENVQQGRESETIVRAFQPSCA